MATHAEIETLETVVIDAERLSRAGKPIDRGATLGALESLARLSGADRDHRNRNHWGTVGVNAYALGCFTDDPEVKSACQRLSRVKIPG